MNEHSNIRVLHIKHRLSNDGATLVEYNFAKALQGKYIFDWMVFASEGNDKAPLFEELGGKVFVFKHEKKKSKLINKIAELREYRSFFRDHHYDIVHIDTDTLRMDGLLYCAKKEGIPKRIIHSHNSHGESSSKGLDKYEIVRRIRRFLISKWATDYLSCSNLAAEWMFTTRLINDNKVVFIKNGIDGERFLFDERKRLQMRSELGLCDNVKLIGHVGRFEKQKNHTFLVEFFHEALSINPNVRLLLIGDGTLKDNIRKKIQNLNLEDKIYFVDSTSEVQNYLCAMDIFVLPSLFEGLPLTCLEAQANGLPTLMADTITTEAKISNLAQFLPIGESKIWAERILMIESNSGAGRIEANKQLYEAGFDINDAAKKLMKVYGGRDE